MLSRHASLYMQREYRKGRADPSYQLSGTHGFNQGSTGLDPALLFPTSRTSPITFRVDVKRSDDGSGTNGVVFEMGSATRGIALALDGSDIIFAAGGNAAATDGATATAAGALLGIGNSYSIVCSAHPGTGVVKLWVNGDMKARDVSTDGDMGAGWAATGDGAVGQIDGTITDRIPAGARVTLVDATILTPVKVFARQLPRQF